MVSTTYPPTYPGMSQSLTRFIPCKIERHSFPRLSAFRHFGRSARSALSVYLPPYAVLFRRWQAFFHRRLLRAAAAGPGTSPVGLRLRSIGRLHAGYPAIRPPAIGRIERLPPSVTLVLTQQCVRYYNQVRRSVSPACCLSYPRYSTRDLQIPGRFRAITGRQILRFPQTLPRERRFALTSGWFDLHACLLTHVWEKKEKGNHEKGR